MADDDLSAWFDSLPDKLQDEIAGEFAEIVDAELVDPIRAAAPFGKTGRLKASVRKEPGPNAVSWDVMAGGETTTRSIGEANNYLRQVVIPQPGDAEGYAATQGIPKGGNAGVVYDYALGVEFGNHHVPAHPFFYSTARAHWNGFVDRVQDLIQRKLSKF